MIKSRVLYVIFIILFVMYVMQQVDYPSSLIQESMGIYVQEQWSRNWQVQIRRVWYATGAARVGNMLLDNNNKLFI